jgi:threonine dehydrogenase-like Zn-dependent dehydrogenase
VPERLQRAQEHGAEVVDLTAVDDVADALRDLTDGRGPDSVLEAVGMEAHGNPVTERVIGLASRLPKAVARAAIDRFGIDRLDALHTAIDAVRRGGTVSISGVYGGAADPMPMMDMFDKGLALRMGQCHVRRWTDGLLEKLSGSVDVFGVESLASHRVPLDEAPEMYRLFQKKEDGCMKVVINP